MTREPLPVAVVAPTLASARSAAVFLSSRRGLAASFFSLAGFLSSGDATRRIVVSPAGRSVTGDLEFLREVRERLLWKAPEGVVYEAIAGLLGSLPMPPVRRRIARRAKQIPTALLLEGTVTPARARAALAGEARLWIVENAQKVRIGRHFMETLERAGVRWRVLEPVSVAAVLASPRLVRVRSRWKDHLPPRTPAWVRRPREVRPRRPTRS